MAASKTRTDWALLLLRLAVGGMAVAQAFSVLRHRRRGQVGPGKVGTPC